MKKYRQLIKQKKKRKKLKLTTPKKYSNIIMVISIILFVLIINELFLQNGKYISIKLLVLKYEKSLEK